MMSTLLKFQATGLSQMYNGQRHTYGHNIMELCNVLVLENIIENIMCGIIYRKCAKIGENG